MRNISKFFVFFFILSIFNSCVEPPKYLYYYQLENKTGQDIEVRLHHRHSDADGDVGVDTIEIANGARGIKYDWLYDSKPPVVKFFVKITTCDSIIILVQDVVVKKYDRKNEDVYSTRTPYNESFYVEETDAAGDITDVYTFLPEDIE